MASQKEKEKREPLFATNHKAGRDYDLLDTFEVGIELKGTEIKSIRQHRVSIDDSFARIDEGEVFLYNMHISPYEQGGSTSSPCACASCCSTAMRSTSWSGA